MKTPRILCIAAIAAAMLSQGCRPKEEAVRENDVVFDHFALEQAYTLDNSSTDYETDSDLTIGCRADIFIPCKFMGQHMKAFRDSILSKAFDTVADDPKAAADSFFLRAGSEIGYPLSPAVLPEQTADSLAKVVESLNNYDGFIEVRGYIAAMTPDYVSYAVTSSSYYPRAAHGMYQTLYTVYSSEAEKVLTLSDIVTPEGIEALPAILRKRALSMRSYIGSTNITALPSGGNYYIDANGSLQFVYQPYEVASYAQGVISIDIEPYILSDYLTATGKQVLLNE